MSIKKTASFGNAKPLPGQANYGVSEADLLEKQAREMEARLKGLQQKMQETSTAPTTGAGGNLWKNSRPEKGGVTTYAKDYQEKLKTKKASASSSSASSSDKTTKATAEGRRMARQKSTARFSEKGADSWTMADVGEWLAAKNMGQYAPNFQQNEINGSVLMDISLEDLDYMGITILGHRKTILKGIEELSSGRAQAPSLAPAARAVSSSADCDAIGQRKQADTKQPLHWSQLEPIANNTVTEDGSTFVNPADEPMDEAAERRAFAEAVAEWRSAGQGGEKAAASDGMWSNPIGAGVNDADDREAHSMGTSSAPASAPAVVRGGGMSLADGQLDEAKERAEFAAAVAAWRGGGKDSSEGTGTGTGTGTTVVPVSGGLSVAEKLAQSMEAEHEKVVARLMEEQDDARRKIIQAARELELAKLQKLESERKAKMDEESESKDEEKKEQGIYARGGAVAFRDSDSDDNLSEASEHNGDNEDEAKGGVKGSVTISLAESTMGLDLDFQAEEKDGGCQYLVEEVSSDEEDTEQKRDDGSSHNGESKY
jgi:hypothetical protein